MKPKPFTKTDFENNVGLNYFIGTRRDVYEGEIIDANDEHLTIERFDRVKDQIRELDISYSDILWAKEDV